MRAEAAETVVELGSGRLVSLGVGAKAANLDRAMGAGLPVPPGFVVVDRAAFDRRSLGPRALAVRSAFSAEDTATESMAGRFHTELHVEPAATAVEAAIGAVRASGADEPAVRLDVLVMEMVDARHAGVAFTQQQFEDDLVNAVEGVADALVSGEVGGEESTLPKLRRWEHPDRHLAPWQQRLASLLRDVRREFGDRNWDIEWADDGATCWLVQIRPVTAPPLRNEAFTIANHKEILPELPSVLMTSVIEAASTRLMDFWTSVDASLPVQRRFVETFDGRPYLNLSMLTDLMRSLGLPTRLVTESYGGEPDVDVGLRPLRTLAKLPTMLRIGRRQIGAERRAERVAAQISSMGRPVDGDRFELALADFSTQYVSLVNEMGALASSLAPPTAVLKRLGVLDLHLSTHRTASTLMLDRLGAVRAAKANGHGPGSEPFDAAWSEWLDHHGHRGVYESDIARPRFAEDPSPISAAVDAAISEARATSRSVSLRGLVTTPVWWAVRRPMAARENLRDQAMRGFANSRRRLLALAERAVADGRLPDTEAIWDLTVDELGEVDRGEVIEQQWLEDRRRERVAQRQRSLPDTVRRFDDLDAARLPPSERTDRFSGLPLTAGVVVGRAFRASEPPLHLPDGFDPSTTVLVARSVDAGWVPIFSRVAGVAVEIGGDLSHGSIVLRELGLPAITNIGDIGSSIATGDEVELDAKRGVLRRIHA